LKTFEQICPEWNKKIQEDGEIRFTVRASAKLDISLPDRCIVGEAHGWSEHYCCEKCEDIAIKFDNLYDYSGIRKADRTEQLKRIFVRHWNKTHEY
jgi:hypothetical protein